MKIKIIAFAALAALIYSCASKTPPPPPPVIAPAEESKTTAAVPYAPVMVGPAMPLTDVEMAAQGKILYDNHCGSCHRLPATTEYTLEKWKPIMDRMARKSGLDDTEKANVMAYIASGLK